MDLSLSGPDISWVSIGSDTDKEEDGVIGYIHVPSKCGLCLKVIRENYKTPAIAMLGNDDSTLPTDYSDVFRYCCAPRSRYLKRWPRGRIRKGNISTNETVVFHMDCYYAFLHNHGQPNALESLWTSAAWRYPWRPRHTHVHKIDFEDHDLPFHDLPLIRPSVATALGMPKLASLPLTILREIRKESWRSKLWNYSAIYNLAEILPMAAEKDGGRFCQVYKLDEIEAWERGQPPAKTDSPSESKITKLTIDRHGIRKIESLPDWPQYDPWRSETRAYVFIDPTQAKKCRFQFKLGLARLSFDSEGPDFPQIWDIPTPPVKGLSLTPKTADCIDPRFRTVDLHNTTGLTFFYRHGSILRIHSHTASSPTELETYRHLSKAGHIRVVWAYVPISPSDRILGSGVRGPTQYLFTSPTFMIRTKLLDDIVLEPCREYIGVDHVFEFTPHILVYTVPNGLGCVTFGAVGEPDPDAQFGKPMLSLSHFPGQPHHILPGNTIPSSTIMAHVPLDGAVRIDIFTSTSKYFTGMCMGIVLQYENGAQRAVGLCRHGIDPVTTYHNPVTICYSSRSWLERKSDLYSRHVECTEKGDTHDHDHEEDWDCSPVKGSIKYTWNFRGAHMEVLEEYRP